MHALENRLPPPLVMLAFALALWLAARALPPPIIPYPVRFTMTALLSVAAAAFLLPALKAFARAGTTVNPIAIDTASALVTTGSYRISRNPMYVGLTLLLAAWAVGLGSAWLLAGPLLYALFITRFQIVPEERVMQARFGDAYTAYRQQVRRWL